MIVDFSSIDCRERPSLILQNANEVPLGSLDNALEVSADLKYNEISTLSFKLPAYVDEQKVDSYDKVVGMRLVDLVGIGKFILMNPKESGDGISLCKMCTAKSLEYEFTYKKISLPNGTYNFYNPVVGQETIISIILELMPSWRLGTVDDSLYGKYRTFEVNNENLYNFIKNTLQNSYNCIFDFDTYNRTINVKSASAIVNAEPVYLSPNNLVKEITIEENTENIFTRLDVNGADGVDIRDVNPDGTNKILNLDYFMTPDNLPPEVIQKYNTWKTEYESYRQSYYNLSLEYSVQTMRKVTEEAKLNDMNGELELLENRRDSISQAIALGTSASGFTSELNSIKSDITTITASINAQKTTIASIEQYLSKLMDQLKAINQTANFKSRFTDEEYILIDKYIKEDSISESSFVATSTSSYTDDDQSNSVSNTYISISQSDIKLTSPDGSITKDIYDIRGGHLNINDNGLRVSSNIVKSVVEIQSDYSFVMTAYLSSGTINGSSYQNACLSITGSVYGITSNCRSSPDTPSVAEGSYLTFTVGSGYLFFTKNVSIYESRVVAWDLYDYGASILRKLSQPTYNFSLNSENFLFLEDFLHFKNSIKLGKKVYTEISDGKVLEPICIGLKIEYDNKATLSLSFSDLYSAFDSAFMLADLLEQSIASGKTVDLKKYTYSAFIDSGASTSVRTFMRSALDVTKNKILSSGEQAVTWDDTGIRIRKWANTDHSAYDDRQMWIHNNNIFMTSDGWETASLAIGEFKGSNGEDLWGVVASNIVGTLIAGENLVIESAKKDNSHSVFKVDGEGAILYNAAFNVANDKTLITLNPDHGIIIGSHNAFDIDENGDIINVDEDEYRFWVDADGNVNIKGILECEKGIIGGWTIAKNLIKNDHVAGNVGLYSGIESNCTDGKKGYIRIFAGASYDAGYENIPFVVSSTGRLKATNADITGKITATSGSFTGTVNANDGSFTGTVNAKDGTFTGTITAKSGSKIGGWNIGTDRIENINSTGTVGLYSGTGYSDGVSGANKGVIRLYAGGSIESGSSLPFFVSSTGRLKATNAYISGTIAAGSTIIGGTSSSFSFNQRTIDLGWTDRVESGAAAIFNGANIITSRNILTGATLDAQDHIAVANNAPRSGVIHCGVVSAEATSYDGFDVGTQLKARFGLNRYGEAFIDITPLEDESITYVSFRFTKSGEMKVTTYNEQNATTYEI